MTTTHPTSVSWAARQSRESGHVIHVVWILSPGSKQTGSVFISNRLDFPHWWACFSQQHIAILSGRLCAYTCVEPCMSVCTCVCTCMCVRMHVHVRAYARACACVHAYAWLNEWISEWMNERFFLCLPKVDIIYEDQHLQKGFHFFHHVASHWNITLFWV